MEKSKIIYASDLHGDIPLIEKLFDEGAKSGASVAIGGDILPNSLPISEISWEIISQEEKVCMFAKHQRKFIADYFIPKLERLKSRDRGKRGGRGREVEEIYLMLGNNDFACNLYLLEQAESAGLVKLLYDRKSEKPKLYEIAKDVYLAGYCYVDLTPFGIKDWEKFDNFEEPTKRVSFRGYKSYNTDGDCEIKVVNLNNPACRADNIEKDLEKIASDIGKEKIKRTIFTIHAPPACTALDTMLNREHVGSFAVRDFIEKYQPLATLHGHIHGSSIITGKYAQKLGETICVNAGVEKSKLRAVLFDASDAGITDMCLIRRGVQKKTVPYGP